jgi:primosomal protein N' (replication factor Y) (superfamily II helicase)
MDTEEGKKEGPDPGRRSEEPRSTNPRSDVPQTPSRNPQSNVAPSATRRAQGKRFVEVAVTAPIRRTFTYEVPESMHSLAAPGRRVLVPFGRRCLAGVIVGPAATIPAGIKILALRQILDPEFSLSEAFLKFVLWAANYYIQPIGEILKAALPPGTHLRARQVYVLLEPGARKLHDLPPGSPERSLLLSLGRRGGRGSFPANRSGAPGFSSLAAKLTAEGCLAKEEDSWEPAVKEKTIKFLRCTAKKGDGSLSPVQEEALEFIRRAGEVPLARFRKEYKKHPSWPARLEKNGFVECVKREAYRPPEGIEDWLDGPPALLSEAQKAALEEITRAVRDERYRPFLLHGVTGSGKTEVYLRAIEETISRGRQALLLVPEISLTAQLVSYFRYRLAHPLAVVHSGLSGGERLHDWRAIKKGKVKLVIGARSAIFAPLDRLGIIVVDEEHDPSYKQEDKVRYHARDLALVRGQLEGAAVILGSATPSMETYGNARSGKFHHLSLPTRIDERPLPAVEIADMREEKGEGRERPIFSRALLAALEEKAGRGEQALLFLNRRGFSTFALCRDCGFVYKCPNCSVSLTYHLSERSYRCHYCDYCLPAEPRCPACSSLALQLFGLGTQRLEEEVKKKLPGVRVGRMDRDTTTRKRSHEKILNQVRRGEMNILIGTQMITKGHDFPGVTLVGVPAADLSLNVPDFRAAERTFQLLTQVAGRAGRRSLPGRVIIQTYNPDHYSIRLAAAQDFAAFFEAEAKFRNEMDYPPFARLVNLRLEGNSEEAVRNAAQAFAAIFQNLPESSAGVEMLGPAPCPLTRLRGKCRWQLLLKGKKWGPLHRAAKKILEKAEESVPLAGMRLVIDVDPVNML